MVSEKSFSAAFVHYTSTTMYPTHDETKVVDTDYLHFQKAFAEVYPQTITKYDKSQAEYLVISSGSAKSSSSRVNGASSLTST